MQKNSLLILLFFCFSVLIFPLTIGAQTTNFTDLGLSVSVNDTNVQNGDLVCSGSEGYKLCTSEYDSSIFGVVNNNPSAAVLITNLTNSQTVISKGETTLRVSSINGSIKKGDFLTSSKTAGIAELSTKTGYVVGTALEDYSSEDPNAVGQIRASINIHANSNITAGTSRQNLIELLRSGLSGLGVDPISALRYLLASMMVIISFVVGFIYFGRIAKTGVEAIGRNPLAGVRIEASVVINIIIMLAVLGVGLGVAYLILAL